MKLLSLILLPFLLPSYCSYFKKESNGEQHIIVLPEGDDDWPYRSPNGHAEAYLEMDRIDSVECITIDSHNVLVRYMISYNVPESKLEHGDGYYMDPFKERVAPLLQTSFENAVKAITYSELSKNMGQIEIPVLEDLRLRVRDTVDIKTIKIDGIRLH